MEDPHPPRPYAGEPVKPKSHTAVKLRLKIHYSGFPANNQWGIALDVCVAFAVQGFITLRRFVCLGGKKRTHRGREAIPPHGQPVEVGVVPVVPQIFCKM